MADAQEKNGSDNNGGSVATSKSCSVLRASAFTTTPQSTDSLGGAKPGHLDAGDVNNDNERTAPSRILLRPSVLEQQAANLCKDSNFSTPLKNSSNTFKLEPPKLFSPFLDESFNGKLVTICEVKPDKDQIENLTSRDVPKTDAADGTNATDASSIPKNQATSNDCSFIFGQKMDDRVVVKSPETSNGESLPSASKPASSSSGQFIFGSHLANRVVLSSPEKPTEDVVPHESPKIEELSSPDRISKIVSTPPSSSASCSLVESAAIQQAKEESKVELKAVEVTTGEENESNVFQFNAKLHVFEKSTQAWVERGRGLLRLNDMLADANRPFQSRLVMRTQGSLRVILNTMIWSSMLVEKASIKTVKISAVDGDEGLKIFLITANPNDAEQVYSAIVSRTQQLKFLESKQQKESTSSATVKKRPSETDGTCSTLGKKQKLDPDQRRELVGEESNDSSTLYPETEASNEGFASSPTLQSSSSSSEA